MIFPYDKIKNAYSCWHITPIQIVAELRDPNKLKKPKRPDLIQAQAALPLPYRNNPADLAINGFPYDTTSDEDRIDLTMAALDTNQDKKADPWELLCWVQWVEEVFQGVSII